MINSEWHQDALQGRRARRPLGTISGSESPVRDRAATQARGWPPSSQDEALLEPGRSCLAFAGPEGVLRFEDGVARRLVQLREAAALGGDATLGGLGRSERKILRKWFPALKPKATARDYLQVIGKLGGFDPLERVGDPTWADLWIGYLKLCDGVFVMWIGQEPRPARVSRRARPEND